MQKPIRNKNIKCKECEKRKNKKLQLSKMAKDLDFKELIDKTRQQLFRSLKIPTSLVKLGDIINKA